LSDEFPTRGEKRPMKPSGPVAFSLRDEKITSLISCFVKVVSR
jgi:hypothetical protein